MARTSTPTAPASSSAAALAARGEWVRPGYLRGVLLVGLLGLVVRGVALDFTPLWSDEAFMAVLMRRSLPAIIDVVHNDNHPPLQYLLVWVITRLGDSAVWLRLPSVLAGTAAVPLAAALGRRIGGDRAGIASGAVVAVTPLLVLWSRDARMYALATTMILAMALALWRAVERPSPGRVALYGLTVLVGLYSHYLVALAVPAHLVAAALFLRPPRTAAWRIAAAAGLAGAALLPWLVYAAPQFRHAGEPYWSQSFTIPGVLGELGYLLGHPGPMTLLLPIAVIGLPTLLWLAVRAYRESGPESRRAMLYTGGTGAFALLILFVVSLKKPLLDERFLNLYVTELLPLAAAVLACTGRRQLVVGAVAGLLVATVVGAASLQTPDVPAIAATLQGRVDPGRDVVALVGPTEYFQVLYYGDARVQQEVKVVDRAVPWYVGLAAFRPGDILAAVPDVPGTIYLVRNPDQADPQMPAGTRMARRQCARGVCLETWTR
jgi:4-amino-4-deoxy-L-arabinose transferase-like glycosyltransferase